MLHEFVRVCALYLNACCVFVWICLSLHRQSQPRHTSHCCEPLVFLSLFFFCSRDVYLQAENLGFSYCMFAVHLLIVNAGKSQNSNAHRRIQRFRGSGFQLCFLHWQQKKKKKFQLFWHQRFGHKIPTLLFFCLFSLYVFFCSFVLEVSPSHFTPWPRVCVPVKREGRFVVVLSSHLRCSPFKRHRFSYKLCDCEWVGRGGFEMEGGPCAPAPPLHSLFYASDYV